MGPTVSQDTAQTSDSACDGRVEAQSFLSSLPQSMKVNTWIKFCPSFCMFRLSQEQFRVDRERRFPPTPHPYFKEHEEAIICYLWFLGVTSHMTYHAPLFPTATRRDKQKTQEQEIKKLEPIVFCIIFSFSPGQRNEGLLTPVHN